MMKKFNEFINEDLLSKNIRVPDVKCDNLKELYPEIQLKYDDDLKIIISSTSQLRINKEFYEALGNDGIGKDDVIFEDCPYINLGTIDKFTKISDYGKFGSGIKDFDCILCRNLDSLDGAPEKVGGDFRCYECNYLTNLQGSPKEVGGDFDCHKCEGLTSLDGSPEKVGGSFECYKCKKLTNLEGASEEVGSSFSCYGCDGLTSLEGAPEKINDEFICGNCENLTSLEGAPETIGGDFRCQYTSKDFIQLAIEKYGKAKVRP